MAIIISIITLITAMVGLIASISTFLINRDIKKILPPDNSLIIKKVLRTPLEEDEWEKLKKDFVINILIVVTAILIIIAFAYLVASLIAPQNPTAPGKPSNNSFFLVNWIQNLVYSIELQYFQFAKGLVRNSISITSEVASTYGIVISLTIIVTYSFLVSNFFLRRQKLGKTLQNGRFFVFKDVIMTVEAEYDNIVKRCCEVLKALKTKSVEINLDAQSLEALKTFRLNTATGIINIEIKPTKPSRPEDTVVLNQRQKCEHSIQVSFLTSHSKNIELKSGIINAFVEQFIGHTKL